MKHYVLISKSITSFYILITYHRVCDKSNTTGATCGAGTAYPSGAPDFTPGFSGACVTQSLVFCVMILVRCLSFCSFVVIVLSVLLRFTDYDYFIGIIKHVLLQIFKTTIYKNHYDLNVCLSLWLAVDSKAAQLKQLHVYLILSR